MPHSGIIPQHICNNQPIQQRNVYTAAQHIYNPWPVKKGCHISGILKKLLHMYIKLVERNLNSILIKYILISFKQVKSYIPVVCCINPGSCLKCYTAFIKALDNNQNILVLKYSLLAVNNLFKKLLGFRNI